jgi:NAD(P)-dependent dehydrogenase (short-subunit alcohol dehydrogenase family)
MTKRVALVTGANRGLGLETCRQLARQGYTVILGSRDEAKGRAAAAELARERLEVVPRALDVSSTESITALAHAIEREFGRLDVLVNNAGILPKDEERIEVIRETMETNVYGPYQLCQALVPLMRKGGYGRIVNVSSGMGQLSDMEGGWPAYRISKTALNAVTRIFAAETAGSGILVNSICPGWVKTDMGGADAERSIPEGADTIVWAATLPENGPTGRFFRDREPIEW